MNCAWKELAKAAGVGKDLVILSAESNPQDWRADFCKQEGAAWVPKHCTGFDSVRIFTLPRIGDQPSDAVCDPVTMAFIHGTVIPAIRNAEAIWFAGGDQTNYLHGTCWKEVVDEAKKAGVPLGGSSAGAMSQGTKTSIGGLQGGEALYKCGGDTIVDGFGKVPFIVESHFDDYGGSDRVPRALAMSIQSGLKTFACDENTAAYLDIKNGDIEKGNIVIAGDGCCYILDGATNIGSGYAGVTQTCKGAMTQVCKPVQRFCGNPNECTSMALNAGSKYWINVSKEAYEKTGNYHSTGPDPFKAKDGDMGARMCAKVTTTNAQGALVGVNGVTVVFKPEQWAVDRSTSCVTGAGATMQETIVFPHPRIAEEGICCVTAVVDGRASASKKVKVHVQDPSYGRVEGSELTLACGDSGISNIRLPRCGDMIVQPGWGTDGTPYANPVEECDDGNQNWNDGCAACRRLLMPDAGTRSDAGTKSGSMGAR